MTKPESNATACAAATNKKEGALSRRAMLAGTGIGALTGGIGLAGGYALGQHGAVDAAATAAKKSRAAASTAAFSPWGKHQAGIETEPTSHVQLLAYKLQDGIDSAALQRMFRILTGDIEALTQGQAPLADSEPELVAEPARLTITVGVGRDLVRRVDAAKVPAWLGPLPAFTHDRLDARWNDGDLLLNLQCDNPLTLAHAARMLHRDIRSFVTPHWVQDGFQKPQGPGYPTGTGRNLMGQIDGTENPALGSSKFAAQVWIKQGWLAGGSALVLRRIRMELDTWEQVDRPGREQTIGRTLDTGAPLSGGSEHTPLDLTAKDENGHLKIPLYAHARRAHSASAREKFYRRGANYTYGQEAGLLFICYQRDPREQFIPVQQRLDELDMLNQWTAAIGSAVFAILPGWEKGGMLGETLFA